MNQNAPVAGPASGRAPEEIALDVHAHVAPIFVERLAQVAGVLWNAQEQVLTLDGHPIGVKELFDPGALIRWMDGNHITKAWISIPPPLYRQQLDATAALAWAQYLNDGLERICADHPRRLAPLFHLPLEHPAVAIAVAEAKIANGARGFAAAAGGRAQTLYSDAALDPLWARLDAQSCFFFMHPGACADGRLKAFYLENLVGNPYETAVAAAHLVSSGAGARYPRIRYCLAHAGGATAMLAGRLQHGYDTARPGVDLKVEPPRQAMRRFFVDCIAHDCETINFAARIFGEDRIVFGSDWPFPMGLLGPHQQLSALAPAARARIFRDNAKALAPAQAADDADRPETG